MRKNLFKYSLLAIIVGLPSVAFGYGEGEDIPHGSRVIHLLTNESRANVPDALAECGANCPEGISCFEEVLPPLWWDSDLYRMAQFHTALETALGCKCQHNSPCNISPTIGSDYPDVCDGSPSCACTDGATTCNASGTSPSIRGHYFTSNYSGENVAWASFYAENTPYTTFYRWLHEKAATSACAFDSSNGHRFNILSKSNGAIGVGYVAQNGSNATQDFGWRAAETPALTSGSHYKDAESTLHFDTHYFSTIPANKVMVMINGECKELSLTHGTNLNGAYGTTSIAEPEKCSPYFFEVQDGSGTITRYPTTGSLLYTVDSAEKQCDKTWRISDASSCFSDTPKCPESQHLNAAGDGCEDDLVNNCGVNGNDCTAQAGWNSGDCVQGRCVVSKCQSGYHVNNSVCEIDSVQHCGAHNNRCDKAKGWGGGECQLGHCVVSSCTAGYHIYNGVCEADSIDNCGTHAKSCASQISDWADGNCTNALCVVTSCKNDKIVSGNQCIEKSAPEDPECASGKHLYNHACEDDSIQNCGSHGHDCAAAIENWADGSCTNSTCVVSACSNNKVVSNNQCTDAEAPVLVCGLDQHPHEEACEDDSIQNCGTHGKVCSESIEFWADGSCQNAECIVSSCTNDKVVINKQCVDNDPGTPSEGCHTGYHEYEDACEVDSLQHCGSHGADCTNDIQNWAGGYCADGRCTVTSCKNDLVVSNNQCVEKSSTTNPDQTSTDPSIDVKIASSDDCSGTPMSSSNTLPIFMLLGIAGMGLLIRRRESK